MNIRIRPFQEKDINDAAHICAEAFGTMHERVYGRRIEFTQADVAQKFITRLYSHPKVIGISAVDENDKVLGTSFIDARDEVAGVGPVTVDPACQVGGVGHALMNGVIEIAKREQISKVRLTQEAMNTVSYSLYLKVGFVAQDQITAFEGKIKQPYTGTLKVRDMTIDDLGLCDELHKQVVGSSRLGCLRDSIESPSPPLLAVNTEGRIIGYTTGFFLAGHSVVDFEYEESAIHALYTTYMEKYPAVRIELKVMCRLYPKLATAALAWGLRMLRNHTLMSIGDYKTPSPSVGLYVPSIQY